MSYLVPAALARDAVESFALSALPNAPVFPDRAHGPRSLHGLSRSGLALWMTVRAGLRGRRQKCARIRGLERDLASYTTRAEVDDLLGAIEGQEGAEADMIRSVLAGNLQQQGTHRLAS